MTQKLYFTPQGLEKLQTQIRDMEKKVRSIQSQTADVAEHGGDDWHDNGGYDALVIDLRGADKRLSDAMSQLNHAVLIPPSSQIDRVDIDTIVHIKRDGREERWKIGGFGESDPSQLIVAYNTPLGELLMRKNVGDKSIGTIAGRKTEIEVLDISRTEKET